MLTQLAHALVLYKARTSSGSSWAPSEWCGKGVSNVRAGGGMERGAVGEGCVVSQVVSTCFFSYQGTSYNPAGKPIKQKVERASGGGENVICGESARRDAMTQMFGTCINAGLDYGVPGASNESSLKSEILSRPRDLGHLGKEEGMRYSKVNEKTPQGLFFFFFFLRTYVRRCTCRRMNTTHSAPRSGIL